ncbi:hypothetical protein ACEWY4_004537 [Coilia grayii]|uniref:Testis-expressed protein 26 n=1 Tax=Coilia grayii TaxID=363190 RepID=A0ABD1KMV4_9TELE
MAWIKKGSAHVEEGPVREFEADGGQHVGKGLSPRPKATMDTSDDSKQWDPYQTSHRRDFVYRPNTSKPVYGTQTASSYRKPYVPVVSPEPVGASEYGAEFDWKPVCKPKCIRTGSSSGTRRNNPHPTEEFLVWRLPRGLRQLSDGAPATDFPTEQQIAKALSAQYRSTYSTNYLGLPQGVQPPTKLKPLALEKAPPYTLNTEMRINYRKPPTKLELQGNTTRYGCNTQHGVAPKGIVPAVVHGHIRNQEKVKQLTTYDIHFGGKTTDISAILRSLQPHELSQLYKHLSPQDKKAVEEFLAMTSSPVPQVNKRRSHTPLRATEGPEWISSWTGPM